MLKIVNARLENLTELYKITEKIVENMHSNGLDLWNKYYPAEVFEEKIKSKELFLAVNEKSSIVGYFSLAKKDDCEEAFKWKLSNGIYFQNFAVNVAYLHKGFGTEILKEAINYAKKEKYNSIRLDVYNLNEHAIALYKKMGFTIVEGEFFFGKHQNKKAIGMELNLKEF